MGSPVYSYSTAEHMQEPLVMVGEVDWRAWWCGGCGGWGFAHGWGVCEAVGGETGGEWTVGAGRWEVDGLAAFL